MLGGEELERRIDVGLKLFRGWHWHLTDKLTRYRVNDLAGVFYMARSPRRIMDAFREKGFQIRKVQARRFSELYPRLREHHCRMLAVERNKILRKARRRVALSLIETLRFLSVHFAFLERPIGGMYAFFFLMPAHTFFAQGTTNPQILRIAENFQGVRELAPEDTVVR